MSGRRRGNLASRTGASIVDNGLTKNALTKNALTKNSLTRNALTQQALQGNGSTRKTLSDDPDSIAVLHYIYSCAMPAGESMTLHLKGVTHTFEGEIGVAPEWGGGACDKTCQQWVSACVLARVNIDGVPIVIDVREPHAALTVGAPEFIGNEGAYFGNLFADGVEMRDPKGNPYIQAPIYTCSRWDILLHPTLRDCANKADECGMIYAGRCETVCAAEVDGVYMDCATPDGRRVAEVVTPYNDPNSTTRPGAPQ